jgi:PAS domain S-box-containing protein
MREKYKPLQSTFIKILIVEDSRIIALDLQRSLTSLGYSVLGIVSSGEQALKKAKEEKPDLILMDIMIEGEDDGIATAGKIREAIDVPIIYLTAYVDEKTLHRAKITEPYGYLLKPYEERILHITIEMAIYKHRIEKRVKENERWLSVMLQSMGECVIATDNEGKVKLLNPAAKSLIGFKEAEPINMPLNQVLNLTDETGKEIQINHNSLINKGSIKIESGAYIQNKSGIKTPIIITGSSIIEDGSAASGSVLIFQDITNIKAAEKEKEKLLEEIKDAQKRLRILSRRMLEIQETERRNIAYELHDQIGQSLTAIKIDLQSAQKKIEDEELNQTLNANVSSIEDALNRIRKLSLDLRPSLIDDLGLVFAIRSYADKLFNQTLIKVKITAAEAKLILPAEIENTSYRVMQELLENIKHHSEAKNAFIDIWIDNNELNIKISDDGKGFDVNTQLKNSIAKGKVGLMGIRERMDLLNGTIDIKSNEQSGTTAHAKFPLLVS